MKKIIIWSSFFLVIVVLGGFLGMRAVFKKGIDLANTELVKKGDIIEEVSVTGKIKPRESANLAFERGGRITRVNFKEGDKVNVGDRLVELDISELLAQLRQAQANVDAQKARLEELRAGTRPEEIAIKESEIKKAEQDLTSYYVGIVDLLNTAYIKADDAVNAKTDQIFLDDNTSVPKLSFSSSDSQAEGDARFLRLSSNNQLVAWKQSLNLLNSNSSAEQLQKSLSEAKERLAVISNFLKACQDVVDKSIGLSVTTVQAYRDSVSLGRTSVVASLTDITTKEQAINSQKIIIERVREELNLKLAGSTKDQLAAQEAQVKQAEASAQLIESQIQKMILRSPLKGIVTKQDAKAGEIVAAGVPIATVISEENFEIEANIPEVDIAKVVVDNKAKVTIDAYGSDVYFAAHVLKIDPAETMIEGVPTYRVTLQFEVKDERLRSGMTANIDIVTNERRDVLVLPQRLVISEGGERYVNLVIDQKRTEKRVIKTGLKGIEGNIEIVEGLSEGDRVLVSTGK